MRHLTTNFGHAIFDLGMPMMNIMTYFGMHKPTACQVIWTEQSDDVHPLHKRLDFFGGDDKKSLMPIICLAPALALQHVASTFKARQICFKNLLVGTPSLDASIQPFGMDHFRDAAYAHFGINPIRIGESKPRVLLLNKVNRRRVENLFELETMIMHSLPNVELTSLTTDQLGNMTIESQVRLMAHTSVLVTAPGGGCAGAVFLHPHATAIIIMTLGFDYKPWVMDLDRLRHQFDVQFKTFHVSAKDYNGTTDEWSCLNKTVDALRPHNYFNSCNMKLVHLDRLLTLVQVGVANWFDTDQI